MCIAAFILFVLFILGMTFSSKVPCSECEEGFLEPDGYAENGKTNWVCDMCQVVFTEPDKDEIDAECARMFGYRPGK
jgi:hypothetical protein